MRYKNVMHVARKEQSTQKKNGKRGNAAILIIITLFNYIFHEQGACSISAYMPVTSERICFARDAPLSLNA